MPSDATLIRAMVSHAALIKKRVSGVDWETFESDEYLHLIVERLLQNIGEAARLVSEPTRAKFPKLPWKQIVGMRHQLVHEYFRTDLKIVYETCGGPVDQLLHELSKASNPPDGEE